jgi:periplasmic protein TonB
MALSSYRSPAAPRLVGIGFVVLLHVVLIYALVTGLAHRAIQVVETPIETRILAEAKPQTAQPPPPPPLQLTPPPTAIVPPPEIQIETPAPPPPRRTAITLPRPVKPPPVAAPAPAPAPMPTPAPAPVPAAEPVRVMPRLDAGRSQQPAYPDASRRLGEQGSVVLQVLIGTDGRVVDAKVLQSSGYERLDQAAIDGVKNDYRFSPGTVDGKPQQMWYTFKFNWKLR